MNAQRLKRTNRNQSMIGLVIILHLLLGIWCMINNIWPSGIFYLSLCRDIGCGLCFLNKWSNARLQYLSQKHGNLDVRRSFLPGFDYKRYKNLSFFSGFMNNAGEASADDIITNKFWVIRNHNGFDVVRSSKIIHVGHIIPIMDPQINECIFVGKYYEVKLVTITGDKVTIILKDGVHYNNFRMSLSCSLQRAYTRSI